MPRSHWLSWPHRAQFWFMDNLFSNRTPRSFSTEMLYSILAPCLYRSLSHFCIISKLAQEAVYLFIQVILFVVVCNFYPRICCRQNRTRWSICLSRISLNKAQSGDLTLVTSTHFEIGTEPVIMEFKISYIINTEVNSIIKVVPSNTSQQSYSNT